MGGVLVDLDWGRCVDAFIALGFGQAAAMLDNYAQTGIFGDLERGKVTPQELYDHIRRQIGRPVADAEITDALNLFITGMPEYKLQMLLDLRKRFGVYLLSNTNAIMLPHIKEKYFTRQGLTFEDYFDRTFLSFEMGEIKPDEKIFLQMIESGEFEPSECLFIDDGAANTEAAAHLGFHVHLAREKEDFRPLFENQNKL